MSTHHRRSVQALPGQSRSLVAPTIQVNDERLFLGRLPGTRSTPLQITQTVSMAAAMSLHGLLRRNGIVHEDKDLFWSEPLLRQIMTFDRIKAQVATDDIASDIVEQWSQTIHATSLKVYAILILMGKQRSIYSLILNGISDAKLPLQLVDRIECGITSEGFIFSCFDDWNPAEREDFVRRQYRVNSKFLDLEKDRKTIKNEIYHEEDVLPFLEDQHKETSGYGAVSKVLIHPDGHGFHDILKSIVTKDYFAVKRLHVNDGEESRRAKDFRNEVEALKRFSGFTHDHLVTLLMTWTIKGSLKDKYCLLFPWADQDLDAYWRDKPCPRKGNNPDAATIRWVAKQIVGMAGALVTIHCPRNDKHLMPKQKYGRHGDIKPENILWYPSPTDLFGILVIADLGLTTFNSTNSRSNVPGQGIPISPGYRPPECDLEGGVFSRAFDIWTFGCLLLEMVCWALGGQDARDEFEELRSTMYVMACKTEIFFDILFKSHGGHAVRVKAEVNQYIARLHNFPLCTEFFHDLLDVIEDHMIVVLSPGRERIRSEPLLARLSEMYKRVADPTDSYCQYPCPKAREVKELPAVDAQLNKVTVGQVKKRKPALQTYKENTEPGMEANVLSAME